MVRVAVAGGTGGLGRTVVEAIIASKKHDVFVLSRKDSDAVAIPGEATVLGIDYASPDAIGAVLRTNLIDTVISCVNVASEESSQAQLNLIEGAARSTTVRRFAPSEFGVDYLEAARLNYLFPSMDFKNAAVNKLRDTTGLSYTRFINGTFMDYLGPPNAPSNLPLISLIIDIANSKAAIPGGGNVPVVFTHSTDVARFVTAALSREEWPEASFLRGDRIILKTIVSLAENAKGCKFDVSYDTVDDLRAGKNTELPANVPRYTFMPKPMIDNISQTIGLAMESGWMNFKGEFLNEILPEVKPMSVEEFFNKHVSRE